ncbi:nicotinate-nucleotide adenylyltransferase [Aquisalimonas sp. 2447]|uniref:nicotinate-nucleotide adenylyltransferase n=1 Tax=Aquisalimonas sp. 2447 TaxID=2740807 RepID=UPI00143270D5|nr:nicotinate-nucleotide adenylyltransferase [Aquisalimonas sp. 2447]QIT57289.1 nicotinate-nucleotide adenylyltransferase [Aquisalimonas sp. 2447]
MVGMFGGTFDPVHNAHLRVALDVVEAGDLERLHLIPCHVPPHRGDPDVTAEHRLAMLKRAAAGEPRFLVDDRELQRDGPSYTVDTLRSLHADAAGVHLVLVVGTDSFLSLPRWHQWRELVEWAHVVVLERPFAVGNMPSTLESWLQGRRAENWTELREAPAGRVLFQPVTPMAVSATDVRARMRAGRSPRYLLPDPVWDYIREHGLYGAGRQVG